jgi:hypothetical protein
VRGVRGIAVVVVTLLSATSCSGQDAGVRVPTPADVANGLLFPNMPAPLPLGAPVSEIVGSLTDGLGVEDGTRALVLALDQGWTIEQVSAAITDGRLAADGSVLAPGGGLTPKEGSPLGNFLDALGGLLRAPPSDSLDEFIAALTASTEAVELNPTRIAAAADSMVRLEASGYPLAQVIEHIPGGYVFHTPGEATVLFDRDGAFVCPAIPTGALDCGELTEEWADVAADVLPEGVVDDAPPTTDGAAGSTPPVATGLGGETCATGTVSFVTPLPGITAQRDDFGVCFVATGGSVSGSFDFVADVVDENCTGILRISGTLTGEFSPPNIGGPADISASLEITSGKCLFDEETIATNFVETSWTGVVEGSVLVATLIDEEGTEALRFEGTIG